MAGRARARSWQGAGCAAGSQQGLWARVRACSEAPLERSDGAGDVARDPACVAVHARHAETFHAPPAQGAPSQAHTRALNAKAPTGSA